MPPELPSALLAEAGVMASVASVDVDWMLRLSSSNDARDGLAKESSFVAVGELMALPVGLERITENVFLVAISSVASAAMAIILPVSPGANTIVPDGIKPPSKSFGDMGLSPEGTASQSTALVPEVSPDLVTSNSWM